MNVYIEQRTGDGLHLSASVETEESTVVLSGIPYDMWSHGWSPFITKAEVCRKSLRSG